MFMRQTHQSRVRHHKHHKPCVCQFPTNLANYGALACTDPLKSGATQQVFMSIQVQVSCTAGTFGNLICFTTKESNIIGCPTQFQPHSSLKIAKQKYTHKQNMGRLPIPKVYAFTRCPFRVLVCSWPPPSRVQQVVDILNFEVGKQHDHQVLVVFYTGGV